MTHAAVADKLFRVMSRTPENERDVVYALVKIRKLLDFDAEKRHLLLRVFCNWVLHNKLEHRGAQAVLKKLDRHLVRYGTWNKLARSGEIFDFVSLDLFRMDLRAFLEQNKMPTVWVDDPFAWQTMISFYGEEILDTPLVVVERKARRSLHLAKAVIESCEPSESIVRANPDQEFRGFKWQFTLSDGHTIRLPRTFNLAVPPKGWITQGVR